MRECYLYPLLICIPGTCCSNMYPKHIGNCTTQYSMIASVIVRDRHLPRGAICYELGVCPAKLEGRWISPPSWPVPPLQMEFGEGAVAETVGLAIITNNNWAAGAPLSPQDHPLSQPPHCDSSINNLQLDLLEVFSCVNTNGCHQTQVRSHCLPLVYGCNSSTSN